MGHNLIGIEAANTRLKKLLVGDFFMGFETGDTFILKMGLADRFIGFKGMSSILEKPIKQSLRRVDAELFSCVDPETLCWATILAATQRKTIMSAKVDETAALMLAFDGSISITFETSIDIVDWQWYVSTSACDPYTEQAEIACLWKAEISSWDDV